MDAIEGSHQRAIGGGDESGGQTEIERFLACTKVIKQAEESAEIAFRFLLAAEHGQRARGFLARLRPVIFQGRVPGRNTTE